MPRGRPKGARDRRPRRRRGRRVRKRVPLALKQHNFVERLNVDNTLLVTTEALSSCATREFKLNQIPQYTHYAELFEFYRIDKIVATFRYKGGNAIPGSDAANIRFMEVNPLLFWKVDHDDAVQQSISVMKESSKTKEHQLTNSKPNFTITFKPAIQAEIYRTSLTSAYAPKWKTWLRTDDHNVPHYGLKMHAIAYSDPNINSGTVEVTYKMYISFKNNE